MKKASPLVLIASLFLSVFFVGIMLFVLLEVLKVGDYHAFPQIITFAGINLAIFALVIGGGHCDLHPDPVHSSGLLLQDGCHRRVHPVSLVAAVCVLCNCNSDRSYGHKQ